MEEVARVKTPIPEDRLEALTVWLRETYGDLAAVGTEEWLTFLRPDEGEEFISAVGEPHRRSIKDRVLDARDGIADAVDGLRDSLPPRH